MKIKQTIQQNEKDWWMRLSVEEQSEIEEGLKQVETGKVVSHTDVMKHFDQWR